MNRRSVLRPASTHAMSVRRPSRLLFVLATLCFMILFIRILPGQSVMNLTPSFARKQPIAFRPSSFDWSTVQEHFPVQPDSLTPLPTGHKKLPKVQHDFPSYEHDEHTEFRRSKVKDVFLKCWNSYKAQAWGKDELRPISGGGKDTFGGWAATIVDALDALYIMDLEDEFRHAAAAAVEIDFADTEDTAVNLFETTIRHLGGLLSAYDLSGEEALLRKAKELGEMLYHAFDTPNRMPGFWLDFEAAKSGTQLGGTRDPAAGPASLSMEFSRLSQLTGDPKYFDAVHRVKKFLQDTQESTSLPGMWPTHLDFQHMSASGSHGYSLGALSDSLYEYLIKTYLLLGGADDSWRQMYARAMEVVEKHLLFRPMTPRKDDVLFSGNTWVRVDEGGRVDLDAEVQHLGCFAGGMFLLGGRTMDVSRHLDIGVRLTWGCRWGYSVMPTGMMPEIFGLFACRGNEDLLDFCPWDNERWRAHTLAPTLEKGWRNAREPAYQLRPEAIESMFVLWRISGDESLRDAAWDMFESIMQATETDLGNAAIANVTVKRGQAEKLDSMESFWLGETLKYFYLIFSPPGLISLDEYVLNTEAHPFKIPR
ncbi:hypothetical protein MKZ38_010467 [Zalerion maritima]|uniref:alpha-1,2-Mannosidase n=1 Tax=Zalerion maritima TaxID=339359 RepID=A0AAD5WV27_9PEZI|nr:hypothetical protein MKZ38_010467 [Zalerion maritima]